MHFAFNYSVCCFSTIQFVEVPWFENRIIDTMPIAYGAFVNRIIVIALDGQWKKTSNRASSFEHKNEKRHNLDINGKCSIKITQNN